MKNLIFPLLTLLAIAIAAHLTHSDPLAYERQRLALETARQLAPLDTLIAAAWRILPLAAVIGFLTWLGAMGVASVVRFRRFTRPDTAGRVPVLLDDQVSARAALGAFHATQRAAASRQPVPHHYAPHYHSSNGAAGLELAGEPARPALPGVTDLASLAFTPSRNAVLLGLGAGGEHITVPAAGLCHVALVGATGGGKSNLLRLLLPQVQAIGGQVVLADPHHAPIDPESGDDWRAIVQRLHMSPAVSAHEIDQLLGYLVDELDRRRARRHDGQRVGAPMFLALDELPVLADSVPNSVDRIGRLLREGRKFGIFSIGASQSMLVKVVGGDSSAREAYRTAFYVGGDLRSASVLLDMPQRTIDESALTTGMALLRSKATSPAQLVRVPYASNAGIQRLLGDDAPTLSLQAGYQTGYQEPATNETGSQPGGLPEANSNQVSTASERTRPASPEAARAASLFQAGNDLSSIVHELRGIKSNQGRRYQQAVTEVQQLIREGLR